MKKIIPFLVLPLIISMLIIIIFKSEEKPVNKLLTVNTNNSYLYSENQTIDLSFYTNDDKLPLNNLEAYNNFYLSDSKETKKLALNLEDVYYSHSEIYLKENYLNYILKFEMPNLEQDYRIDEAYLNFSLKNNQFYQIKIGCFNLIYLEPKEELNWTSLDSKKKDSQDHSISKIIIQLENNLSSNLEVNTGNSYNQDYEYENDLLIVYLDSKNYFINNIPLIIKDNYQTFYINNTYYIKEFALLSKASNLVNIYEFN